MSKPVRDGGLSTGHRDSVRIPRFEVIRSHPRGGEENYGSERGKRSPPNSRREPDFPRIVRDRLRGFRMETVSNTDVVAP